MWMLGLAILIGVVVLATGMRSSVDENGSDGIDGLPFGPDDVGEEAAPWRAGPAATGRRTRRAA